MKKIKICCECLVTSFSPTTNVHYSTSTFFQHFIILPITLYPDIPLFRQFIFQHLIFPIALYSDFSSFRQPIIPTVHDHYSDISLFRHWICNVWSYFLLQMTDYDLDIMCGSDALVLEKKSYIPQYNRNIHVDIFFWDKCQSCGCPLKYRLFLSWQCRMLLSVSWSVYTCLLNWWVLFLVPSFSLRLEFNLSLYFGVSVHWHSVLF